MPTASEKLACAERELRMRKRVYPRWVKAERMTSAEAAREVGIMEAIAADYRAASTFLHQLEPAQEKSPASDRA
jgi:hypothetical protein